MVGCKVIGNCTQYCHRDHRLYDPSKSTTAVHLKTSFKLKYGTGFSKGENFKDFFAFGVGRSAKRIPIPIVFGGGLENSDDVGVLGLSLKPFGMVHSHILEVLDDTKIIDKPIFSVFFKRCDRENFSDCHDAGVITFGAIDKENCGRPIGWTPILDYQQLWKFHLQGFAVRNYKLHRSVLAVIDTGSSHIYLPADIYKQVKEHIGAYSCHDRTLCVKCTRLFQIALQINNQQYILPRSEITTPINKDECELLLAVEHHENNRIIFGASFYRSFCIVHDWFHRRVVFLETKSSAHLSF